jgi:hypothetical protein
MTSCHSLGSRTIRSERIRYRDRTRCVEETHTKTSIELYRYVMLNIFYSTNIYLVLRYYSHLKVIEEYPTT